MSETRTYAREDGVEVIEWVGLCPVCEHWSTNSMEARVFGSERDEAGHHPQCVFHLRAANGTT